MTQVFLQLVDDNGTYHLTVKTDNKWGPSKIEATFDQVDGPNPDDTSVMLHYSHTDTAGWKHFTSTVNFDDQDFSGAEYRILLDPRDCQDVWVGTQYEYSTVTMQDVSTAVFVDHD